MSGPSVFHFPIVQRRAVNLLGQTALSGALIALLGLSGCAATGAGSVQTLRVGTSGDYLPFSGRDAKRHYRGLDIDMAHRLGADLGYEIALIPFAWPALLADVDSDRFDIAMSGVTMRADRAERARYSRPYAQTGVVILLRDTDLKADSGLGEIDARRLRLAVNHGGHLERWSRRHLGRSDLVTVTRNQSLPRLLAGGSVDGIVSDSAESLHWQRPGWTTLGPYSADYKALLLPARSVGLAARIDSWLIEREADGWLEARRRYWLRSAYAPRPDAATRYAVAALVGLRLGLMPAVAAAKRQQGQAIEDEAQEARVLKRVASATSQLERVRVVYSALIEAAKAVQRASDDTQLTVSLEVLRNAIGRIDEQLVREIERLPPCDIPCWQRELTPALADLPLSAAQVESLSAALSTR
jgi:cyclohexadienyl dehydratase